MTIPKETLEKWNALRERGDMILLAQKTGVNRTSLHHIFTTGECSVRVAEKINAFYKSRQNKIKSITLDQGDGE